MPCRLAGQRGFTLVELTVVLVIGAGFMLMMTLSMQVHALQLAVQSQAERYLSLQAAAQRYVQKFRVSIQVLPAVCSRSLYRTEAMQLPPAVKSGACSASLSNAGNDVTVFNVLQPTVEELRRLGLLGQTEQTRLLLPTVGRALTMTQETGAVTALAQLGVLLRNICTGEACAERSMVELLVYNIQPFQTNGGIWLFNRRDQVNMLFSVLGNGGAIASDARERWDLVGLRNSFRLVNPIADAGGFGEPGVVGLRSILSPPPSADSVQLEQAHVKSLEVESLRLPSVSNGEACVPTRSSLAVDSISGVLQYCHKTALVWTAIQP